MRLVLGLYSEEKIATSRQKSSGGPLRRFKTILRLWRYSWPARTSVWLLSGRKFCYVLCATVRFDTEAEGQEQRKAKTARTSERYSGASGDGTYRARHVVDLRVDAYLHVTFPAKLLVTAGVVESWILRHAQTRTQLADLFTFCACA